MQIKYSRNYKYAINNITLYYNAKPVKLVSVDNNIGTAYVQSLNDTSRFKVDLEQLHEQ